MQAIQRTATDREDDAPDIPAAENAAIRDSRHGTHGWRRSLRESLAHIRQWREVQRGRTELRKLDARALQDIGITRMDVLRESRKPSWRQ